MAKHTKRRAAEKHRRGKGSRKYGGKVKNTDGTVVSGVRGTIANALIDEGLNKMYVDKKVLLFNSLNGLIRTKQGIKAYQIDITNVVNQEPSMKWTDIGSNAGAVAFKVGSFFTSSISDTYKIVSPLERVARSLRDIYKKADGSTSTATVNDTKSTPTDIGDLYLSVAKDMSIRTRPAVILFKPSSVEITKDSNATTKTTLTLSTELTNDKFINNILFLYARMED